MPEIINPSFEPAWQDYVATAQTHTGERLTPYSPLYQAFRDAFAAGFAARDAEVEALRGDVERAFGAGDAPAPVVDAPVEPAVPAADHVVVARVLRAAADEASDIERIGQTPYASISADEAEQFNGHPLSNLYRQSDTQAHITWLRGAADAADAGFLPAGL